MEWFKSLVPVVLALATGGGVYGFILSLLNRKDAKSARDDNIDRIMSTRGRVYELAYREQDAWTRQIVQTGISFAIAHHKGEKDLEAAFGKILCSMFLDEVAGDALGYHLKPYPDFIAAARDEIDKVDGGDEEAPA